MIGPDDLRDLATAVVDELQRRGLSPAGPALRVEDVAIRLNVRPDYVYRHARELGGWKLPGGNSGKGRWRFPPERLTAALDTHEDDPPPMPPQARQGRAGAARQATTGVELLPIRGATGVPSRTTTTKRARTTKDRRAPDQEGLAP